MDRMRLKVRCRAAEKCGDAITVRLSCDAGVSSIPGGRPLLAAGHRPNTDGFVSTWDVNTDTEGFIAVCGQCRINVSDIGAWAMVNCRYAFARTSYSNFELVAASVFDSESRLISGRIPPHGVAMVPPLGLVGMTEHQVGCWGSSSHCA